MSACFLIKVPFSDDSDFYISTISKKISVLFYFRMSYLLLIIQKFNRGDYSKRQPLNVEVYFFRYNSFVMPIFCFIHKIFSINYKKKCTFMESEKINK